VLSLAQIESFVDEGYSMLPGAFTAQQAASACRCLWRRIEEKTTIREKDPATWPAALQQLYLQVWKEPRNVVPSL
jgi:hypothetical protein